MKKTLLLTAAVIFAASAAWAQTVLKEKTHGLLPGNPNPMIQTEATTPGAAGENVTWDFSTLKQKAGFYGDITDPGYYNPPLQAQKSNTVLVEDDIHSFMTTSSKELKVLTTRVGTFLRVYNEPVVKMRYPFAYGDKYAATVTGEQFYTDVNYHQTFELTYSVDADAYGTLLLPGTTLKDVLRVTTTQTYAYDNYASTVVTYRWYVKSHRYPVLAFIFGKREDGTLYPIKGAYNPVVEAPALIAKAEKQAAKGAVTTLNLYPNPFDGVLNVNYTLSAQSYVTIALYNAQGMLVKTLLQQNQEEGTYTSTFTSEVQNLPVGMYILRAEANGGVLAQEVVKVQ